MPTLVVFDLDGTLVDSRQDLAASMSDVLTGLGAAAVAVSDIERMVGEGARTLVQRALAHAGCDADLDIALKEFHRCYAIRLLETTRPYPGVEDMLQSLRTTARLALLTNKPTAPTVRLLDHFGWTPVFGRVIGGDGAFPRKPDPAALQDLMRWARARPGETMMVGDSMMDVQTARNAGVSVCVAAYGFGHSRGDLVLRGDERIAHAADQIPALWSGVQGPGSRVR